MGPDPSRQEEQSHREWRVLCSLTFWSGGVCGAGSGGPVFNKRPRMLGTLVPLLAGNWPAGNCGRPSLPSLKSAHILGKAHLFKKPALPSSLPSLLPSCKVKPVMKLPRLAWHSVSKGKMRSAVSRVNIKPWVGCDVHFPAASASWPAFSGGCLSPCYLSAPLPARSPCPWLALPGAENTLPGSAFGLIVA